VEGRDHVLEMWIALITTVDGKRVLGEWQQMRVGLPYLGFRRYFRHPTPPKLEA
jgi:hypothetical protein